MTFVSGQILSAADLNAELAAPFPLGTGAWTNYTPVWTQGATTITKTIGRAAYYKVGRLVVVSVDLSATGAGTANNALAVTLPVTAAAGGALGPGWFSDSGVGYYSGVAILGSTTVTNIYQGGLVTNPLGATGGGFTAAVAAGDRIIFSGCYESAS